MESTRRVAAINVALFAAMLASFGIVELALWALAKAFEIDAQQWRDAFTNYHPFAFVRWAIFDAPQLVSSFWDALAQAPVTGPSNVCAVAKEACNCYFCVPKGPPIDWQEVWDATYGISLRFAALTAALGAVLALVRWKPIHGFICGALRLAGWGFVVWLLYPFGRGFWWVLIEATDLVSELLGKEIVVLIAAVILARFLIAVPRGEISALLRFISEAIRLVQDRVRAFLTSEVHTAFPRRPHGQARGLANGRRERIEAFLESGALPPLRREYRMAPGDRRKFREHVVRRQVEEDDPPKLVNHFLEFPKGAPMVLKQPCLAEGFEEAVGQFVRLNFELQQQPSKRSSWLEYGAPERHDEIIVPLLARVVDAAILADLHADTLRRETDWIPMPFYERIYAEYKEPSLWMCLLRPAVGDLMQARVVIETHYPHVFFNALFGAGKVDPARYANWFGIGIQIEKPNEPHTRRARLLKWFGLEPKPVRSARAVWRGAQQEPLCRRLKSHAASVVSGRIDVALTGPAPAGEPGGEQQTRGDAYHIMASGPLADGCPSVVRPAPYPEPFVPTPEDCDPPPNPLPPEYERVKIPLPPRGTVSNAPPIWLFPPAGSLFADCRGNCLLDRSKRAEHTMNLAQSAIGTMTLPAGLLPRRYRAPDRRWLYHELWSGAYFSHELGIANRFPLFGCSYTAGEMNGRTKKGADLRGGFARTMCVGWRFAWLRDLTSWLRGLTHRGYRDWLPFGGVFVSTDGPEHAGNLLLPEPLLHDYLNHLAQRDAVMDLMKECKGPPFVPKPQETESR